MTGLIGSGFLFARAQYDYPDIAEENFVIDLGNAVLLSVFGLATLVVGFCMSGFGKYGWWIWFKKTENP